jgi:hypothetical protein
MLSIPGTVIRLRTVNASGTPEGPAWVASTRPTRRGIVGIRVPLLQVAREKAAPLNIVSFGQEGKETLMLQ